ncbi:MAG: hypothetical protein ACK53V_26670, partial [Planctomycetota bacterium]
MFGGIALLMEQGQASTAQAVQRRILSVSSHKRFHWPVRTPWAAGTGLCFCLFRQDEKVMRAGQLVVLLGLLWATSAGAMVADEGKST